MAGSDPAWAEVWSKSLFVAGDQEIGELARRRRLAAWWIDAHGQLSMTPAADALTGWITDDLPTTRRDVEPVSEERIPASPSSAWSSALGRSG